MKQNAIGKALQSGRVIAAAGVLLLMAVICAAFGLTEENAYAGDGFDVFVYGIEADETVDPGSTLKVKISDLPDDVRTNYNAGYYDLYWGVADAGFVNGKRANTYVSGDFVCADVKIADAGKYYTFYAIKKRDDLTNYNSKEYLVNKDVEITSGPSISTSYYKTRTGFLKMKYEFQVTGYTQLRWPKSGNNMTVQSKTVRIFRNGKKVAQKTTSTDNGWVAFKNVAVRHNRKENFKVQLFIKIGSKEWGGPYIKFTEGKKKLGKNKVYATKISKKHAALTWTGVKYATGYKIYKGSRLVKKVGAKKRRFRVKKRGAGKARYRVVPIRRQGGRTYKGTSNRVKPKKNVLTLNRDVYYGNVTYATCPFRITKISLKGNVYTVTGYAVNNRIFKMKRYKGLLVALKVNGRKAFRKRFASKTVNCPAESSKKIVLKVKGRAGVDLRYGGTMSYTEGGTPVWTY